ncbi:hypothetical protein LCGC14_1648840, partial [marine sediment metagenome]
LLRYTDLSILKERFFVFAGIFFLCAVVSGFFAVNKSEWLYSVLRIGLFVTTVFVFASILKDEMELAKVIVLLGFFYFLYGQYEFISNSAYNCKGLMCNKNPWSTAQFLCLPFCVYLIKEKGFWRWLSITVGLGLLANIFVLTTRSVVLAVGISVLCLIQRRTLKYIIPILIVAGAYLLMFKWIYIIDTVSMTERWQAWRATLTMIYENPLGVGAGNWCLMLFKYGQNLDFKFFQSNIFRHPHNDFIWILAEVGVIGFVGYLGMFFTSLYYAAKSKKQWLVAGIMGYMALAFFSFPNERAFSSMILAVFMALSIAGYHKIPKRSYIPNMGVFRMASVNIVLMLCLFLVVLGYRHRSLIYNKKLRESKQWEKIIDFSDGFSPFSTLTFTGVPYHWFKGVAYNKTGDPVEALVCFREAQKYSPYNVHVLNALGLSYSYDKEKADRYFAKAIGICPVFDIAINNRRKIKESKK